MKPSAFLGVVWPRQINGEAPKSKTADGKPTYRYVVVGMLVSETELRDFKDNEIAVFGDADGMAATLWNAQKLTPDLPTGDANSVLRSLGQLQNQFIAKAEGEE